MSRFVRVRADHLLKMLRAIGAAVSTKGGTFHEKTHAREIVVDIVPPHARAMVRVYTSLAVGSTELRESGQDAIRILVCVEHPEGFKTLETPRKVLRTAKTLGARGQFATEDDREKAFLARLNEAIRDAYRQAFGNEPCPACGRATARRSGPGGEFRGCSGYPACKGTLPARTWK